MTSENGIESKDGYVSKKHPAVGFTLEVFGKDYENLSENDSQRNSRLLII